MLIDSFGRTIDYLRISVTDRCDFHCVYCDPSPGRLRGPSRTLLDLEAFTRVARVGAGLGVSKIKLTGGEPLLFRDIVPLVGRLASMPALADLSITTNGSRLERLAAPLYDAGLRRINLSLDSLRTERFARMTRGGNLDSTLRALELARRLGYRVKINTVVLDGWNGDELPHFARFALERDVEVRFIEFMPFGRPEDSRLFVSAARMRERLGRHHSLSPLEPEGVATRFVTEQGGRIGFIPAMSEAFCGGCRRLRLTAWGALRPCLFSTREVDLGALLAAGADDAALGDAILRAVSAKPERNGVLAGREDPLLLEIRSIGG